MQVTKTFIDVVSDSGNVDATATVYLDGKVAVHDIRVLKDGRVCMPSRQKRRPCVACWHRCGVLEKFCSECGAPLRRNAVLHPYFEVTHPLDCETRDMITAAVKEALECTRTSMRQGQL